MYHRDVHRSRRRRYGKHLVAVAEYHHRVGTQPRKRIGSPAIHCAMTCTREASSSPCTSTGTLASTAKTCGLNLAHRIAIARHKVHIGGKNLHLHAAAVAQSQRQRAEAAPSRHAYLWQNTLSSSSSCKNTKKLPNKKKDGAGRRDKHRLWDR